MLFPYVSAITAGILLVLQIFLALTVSISRMRTSRSIGDGGDADLLRAVRRHGNAAENIGIFVAGFTLLELSRQAPLLLLVLCLIFVLARVFHALGLSTTRTVNLSRRGGATVTYLVGLILGLALIWVGVTAAIANHAFG